MEVRIERKATHAKGHRILDVRGRHVGWLDFYRERIHSGRIDSAAIIEDFIADRTIRYEGVAYYEGAKRVARAHFQHAVGEG